MTADFIVWIPGTGLVLHYAWKAWRRWRVRRHVAALSWQCINSDSPTLPDMLRNADHIAFLLREIARKNGELP